MQTKVVIAIILSISGAFAVDTHSHTGKLRATPVVPVQVEKKGSLNVPSWNEKIPDIAVNLKLANEWMNVETAVDAIYEPNGTIGMVVGVKDAKLFHKCGLAMNVAWGAMAHDPCTMRTWIASDAMKDMVEPCSKLRHGDRYMESYRALKTDQDTWCGGPNCRPDCHEGVKCVRSSFFPFDGRCSDVPDSPDAAKAQTDEEAKLEKEVEGIFAAHGMLWIIFGAILVILCLGGLMFVCNKQSQRLSGALRNR